MNKIILAIICGFFAVVSLAQETKKEQLVQFSGVVVSGDKLDQLPFTSILIKNSNRGTMADVYGYFSFVAQPNDTLMFGHIGFKDAMFIIPDTLTTNRYSIIQVLNSDTITLPETVIYPWPSKEEFKKAFLTLDIPEDDYIRADKNLDPKMMQLIAMNTHMDGSENFKAHMMQQQTMLYRAGNLYPTISLLDPIAWAKFVKAWKNGDLKKQ